MKIKEKHLKIMKWTARILSVAIILLGLPFYFGYGNPLPFVDSDYTAFDNIWLMIFPLMFIGLGIGWIWEKIGGYLVTIPVVIGLLMGIFLKMGMVFQMLVPLVPGVLYLIVGYGEKETR
jgi:hypothetical protein